MAVNQLIMINVGEKSKQKKPRKPRLNVPLPPDLEREFRNEVGRRLGVKKGNISISIEEAIREWIKSGRRERK